ncbi:MAG: protein Mflv [Chlamydiia bacterium]|nr:protein Mflv [Chlamydiia bacterium]
MTRYWIGVASYEHVKQGVLGGFAQVCHGKGGPLQRMHAGDWILYYSPTIHFGAKDPYRAFTAIGKVKEGDAYIFSMSETFHPWRRDVHFLPSQNAPIELLLEELTFIKDKKKWGFPFRRGCFEINDSDFQVVAKAMGVCLA